MRARMAASAAPSVTAGSTRCASVPRPPTGSQPSSTANTIASKRPKPEIRNRDADERQRHRAVVDDRAAPDGGDDAERQRNQHGHGHRRERELRGRGHALENLLQHRLIVSQRHAEVAAHQSLEKRSVLHEQRAIEAETLAELRDVFRRRAFAEHRLRGIAGDEMNERKDQRRHAEQDRDRQQQPADEVSMHRDEGAASVSQDPGGSVRARPLSARDDRPRARAPRARIAPRT